MRIVADMLAAGPVIPALSFASVAEALAASDVLYGAGLRVFEITLADRQSFDYLTAVAKKLPADAYVGGGAIMVPQDITRAKNAGAAFGVSPGFTRELAEGAVADALPFLPGVSSVSEAMAAQAFGFKAQRFFPAEQSGGAAFLKTVAPVLADIVFSPAGGVTLDNAPKYLNLTNVVTVGAPWLLVRDESGVIDLTKTAAMVSTTLGALTK